MMKRTLRSVVFNSFLAGLTIVAWAGAGRSDEATRITLRTTPPSAISIDGKPAGKSPVEGRIVTPGYHRIEYYSKEKGERFEFELPFKAGKHFVCTYDFATAQNQCNEQGSKSKGVTGQLELDSDPPSEVYIDGHLIGRTPIARYYAESGPHTLEFKHPDHPSITKNIDVQSKGRMKIRVQFETAQEPTAK